MKKVFALIFCLSFILVGCFKETNYLIHGSQYITEENRKLVGTEINEGKNNVYLKDNIEQYTLETNHIIKSIDSESLNSAPIIEFTVKEGDGKSITPEIITTNGSISVLKKEDSSGWKLNKGDTLVFNFNKYESRSQSVVIGYVLNGKMVNGEKFKDLSGSYKFTANESGEYYVYIINVSSDYVAFKEGNVISKS